MFTAVLHRTVLGGLTALALTAAAPAASTGTVIALNKAENTASLIDLASREVVATLPTGAGPHEVATSPDGRLAVLTNYGNQDAAGASLTVLDIPRARVIRTINLDQDLKPHGIRFFPDGETVLVTSEESQAVLAIDVDSGQVVGRFPTGQEISHMLALAPDGGRAFIANIGSGTVTALDMASGSHLGQIATGEGAEGIDITPDGRHVWVTNRAADTVSVIDARSLEILATLPSPSFPIRATVTPDGRHVLVSHARSGDVAVFNAITRKEERRIPMELSAEATEGRLFGGRFGDSSVPIGILIHPDGTQAYVANANADVISILDLTTWKLDGFLTAGREPDGLAFSSRKVEKRQAVEPGAGGGAGDDPGSSHAAGLTGFALADRQPALDLEQRLDEQITSETAEASLALLASPPAETDDDQSVPAVARQVLNAFEAAGLDAGIWDFSLRPANGSRKQSAGEAVTGFHTMARIPGSDLSDQVVFLATSMSGEPDVTGLAGLLTLAQGLGELLKSGWHPRRTMVLAAWDAGLPARQGSRAWLEHGPMQAANSTVALLTVDSSLGGSSPGLAATPQLRSLAAAATGGSSSVQVPIGHGAAATFISAGVPTVEIGQPHGNESPSSGEQDQVAAGVAAGARLWGGLALRLADAALPVNNPAVLAQRILEHLNEIDELARAAFADNAPPQGDLRRALVRLRTAGEEWNLARTEVLAHQGAVPRGNDGASRRENMEESGTAAMAATRLLGTEYGPRTTCNNLIYCADGETPARFLPGLLIAIEAGDRSGFVAETLILATAVSRAAGHLQAATTQLSANHQDEPVPATPGS